jgi:hypothetical protein
MVAKARTPPMEMPTLAPRVRPGDRDGVAEVPAVGGERDGEVAADDGVVESGVSRVEVDVEDVL